LIRGKLKDALQTATINKEVCIHTLRHTFATNQLEAGQDIMTLKDMLGHSHINTYRKSNAMAERLNGKIQEIKTSSKGYRTYAI